MIHTYFNNKLKHTMTNAKFTHSCRLLKFDNKFMLYFYIHSNHNINKINLKIHTKKLLEFGILNENKFARINTEQKIIIPTNSFFAHYENNAVVAIKKKNNTFVAIGDNNFEQIDIYFSNKLINYNFTVQKEHYYLDL